MTELMENSGRPLHVMLDQLATRDQWVANTRACELARLGKKRGTAYLEFDFELDGVARCRRANPRNRERGR